MIDMINTKINANIYMSNKNVTKKTCKKNR